MNSIQLSPSCIYNVPIQTYDIFTFIVNGKKHKTTRLLADLISPVISKIHMNDPTFNIFKINTSHKGDFSHILRLGNFKKFKFSEEELPFILEVFDIIGNGSIEFKIENTETTNENVFDQIQQYPQYKRFYTNASMNNADFISSHFYELCENNIEQLSNLPIDFISRIIDNDNLRLKSEDQLLKFVNELYSKDSTFSILYENVMFCNVSTEGINEFISVFNSDDISQSIWLQLTKRLSSQTITDTNFFKDEMIKNRYNSIEIKPLNTDFKGIINYLREKSNGEIDSEISITASSVSDGSYQPHNVALFDKSDEYKSISSSGSWLCFDFRKYKVIPTNYMIKSSSSGINGSHPKSWVIECSDDQNNWEKVDQQDYCPYLNGPNFVHIFNINNKKSNGFRYIRMRMTSQDYSNNYYLNIHSFELFGELISNNSIK